MENWQRAISYTVQILGLAMDPMLSQNNTIKQFDRTKSIPHPDE